ncbi:MAG: zf-HC2 domain-containing protein [Gemmatimonadales bacterium]
MSHMDERRLDDLLAGNLSEEEEREFENHLRSCPECRGRMEEWKRLFPAVKRFIPTAEHGRPSEGRWERLRILLPPGSVQRFGREHLWAAGVLVTLLALVTGYLLLGTRGPADPAGGAGLVPVGPPANPAIRQSVPGPDSVPKPAARPRAVAPAQARPGTAEPTGAAGPRPTTRAAEQPTPPALSDSDPAAGSSRDSSSVTLSEAAVELGGAIRLLGGQWPAEVRLLPGHLVPGAAPDRTVVRLIYEKESGRIILDQQRTGRDGPATEVATGTAATGVSVAQWTDAGGFWLSLAGRMTENEIRSLSSEVR